MAIGTLSAVIVALFSQAFRKKFFPPKLALQLVNPDGEKTHVQLTWYENNEKKELQKDARYYHLRVTNSRRWSSANQVQVILLQVDAPGPNQKRIPELFFIAGVQLFAIGQQQSELFRPCI